MVGEDLFLMSRINSLFEGVRVIVQLVKAMPHSRIMNHLAIGRNITGPRYIGTLICIVLTYCIIADAQPIFVVLRDLPVLDCCTIFCLSCPAARRILLSCLMWLLVSSGLEACLMIQHTALAPYMFLHCGSLKLGKDAGYLVHGFTCLSRGVDPLQEPMELDRSRLKL